MSAFWKSSLTKGCHSVPTTDDTYDIADFQSFDTRFIDHVKVEIGGRDVSKAVSRSLEPLLVTLIQTEQ